MKAEKRFGKETRQLVIDQLIQQDKQAFLTWKDSLTEPRLDIPEDALRYLIPPRIFELADDPGNIKVRTLDCEKSKLRVFIVEEKEKILLPGEDKLLDVYKEELADGRLTRNDRIAARIQLLSIKNLAEEPVLKVDYYFTPDEKLQLGIGTDFYKRLRQISKEVGFEYIEGLNNSSNLTFFTEKLGRHTYENLPEHIKPKFAKPFGTRTYDILNPIHITPPEAPTLNKLV